MGRVAVVKKKCYVVYTMNVISKMFQCIYVSKVSDSVKNFLTASGKPFSMLAVADPGVQRNLPFPHKLNSLFTTVVILHALLTTLTTSIHTSKTYLQVEQVVTDNVSQAGRAKYSESLSSLNLSISGRVC